MVWRICAKARLQMRRRGGGKRVLGACKPMVVPDEPNQRWSLDFVSDAFMNSCRFRVFAIVDDFSRECLGLVADTSLSGLRVARELPEVMRHRGRPKTIISELPSIAT